MKKVSEKPLVIQRIFDRLWDADAKTFRRTMVTMNDVLEAIRWCNANKGTNLSERNPANFFKDFIRRSRASQLWPAELQAIRWTARQVTGDGLVFEFVPYAPSQVDAFPDRFTIREDTPKHDIQSLSIPLASKQLGRNDETYLIQIAVKLAIIETHFALYSPLRILELSHIQIGIKLRKCEVDSLFAATLETGKKTREQIIITCEAKKRGQRILEEQIIRQVEAAFEETDARIVVPIAMVAVKGGIHVVEFKAVERKDLDLFAELSMQSDAWYRLHPRVKGI